MYLKDHGITDEELYLMMIPYKTADGDVRSGYSKFSKCLYAGKSAIIGYLNILRIGSCYWIIPYGK